jgi:hypothetical protein
MEKRSKIDFDESFAVTSPVRLQMKVGAKSQLWKCGGLLALPII